MTVPAHQWLADAYRTACYLDVESFKPGNVSWAAPGHGMSATDFVRSAEHSVGPLVQPGLALGERIVAAVAATRDAVGCNTNLGIVLLVAPLVQACLDHPALALPDGVVRVLAATTRADATATYRAIRLAAPGGLGHSESQDVAHEPDRVLTDAMALAAGRDLIARQYANGFADLHGDAVPYLAAAGARWDSAALALTDLYLYLLGRHPDTHVQRKHGARVAEDVRQRALAVHRHFLEASGDDEREDGLRRFDAALKRSAINPGTTADLCVAASCSCRLQLQVATHTGSSREHPRTPPADRLVGPLFSIRHAI